MTSLKNMDNTVSVTLDFPIKKFTSNTAYPTFYRTYSRLKSDGQTKESVVDVYNRNLKGIFEIGNYTTQEKLLIVKNVTNLKSFFSGRWMWVGGCDFLNLPKNYYAAYNCIGMSTESLKDFGRAFNFLMQGCGVGASVLLEELRNLPKPLNKINLVSITEENKIGSVALFQQEHTTYNLDYKLYQEIVVGDSREGWVDAVLRLFDLFTIKLDKPVAFNLKINLKNVRKKGSLIKGFGGVSNPADLRQMFIDFVETFNSYVEENKDWDSFLATWSYGRTAKCTVAGNVRRSAELMQGSEDDESFTHLKQGLWKQESDGSWKIDPLKDPLRMANHTRMFFHKPTLEEIKDAVTKQYTSGEGAIGYAPMSVIRANVDILNTEEKRKKFHNVYLQDVEEAKLLLKDWFKSDGCIITDRELEHRLGRFRANPCYEVIGKDFLCNLSEQHLNEIDPLDLDEQIEAFTVGGLIVASLLHHKFDDEKFSYSRELDPIVGVSFTGLFDFFVKLFGSSWLKWWSLGRPDHTDYDVITIEDIERYYKIWPNPVRNILQDWDKNVTNVNEMISDGKLFKTVERFYLELWRDASNNAVWGYCDRNGLKRPNRCTVVQPAGTKSLLTGASCGWHPPKAQRYIRRITFGKNHPVALACLDYGYSVIPSQSDKDENGKLLDDPFDPRCTEWLVEIPVEVEWADVADQAGVDISKFSATAQFDFFMQVQTYYTAHNTSATIELREEEIEPLSEAIYNAIQNETPYISAALLARFDALETFPRLPFEPVSKEAFDKLQGEVLQRRKSDDFYELMNKHNGSINFVNDDGSVACESEYCAIKK